MYLWMLKVTGLGKICGQSHECINILETVGIFINLRKMRETQCFSMFSIIRGALACCLIDVFAVCFARSHLWEMHTAHA